jgi:exosome complex RNA-binding protein Csl4
MALPAALPARMLDVFDLAIAGVVLERVEVERRASAPGQVHHIRGWSTFAALPELERRLKDGMEWSPSRSYLVHEYEVLFASDGVLAFNAVVYTLDLPRIILNVRRDAQVGVVVACEERGAQPCARRDVPLSCPRCGARLVEDPGCCALS